MCSLPERSQQRSSGGEQAAEDAVEQALLPGFAQQAQDAGGEAGVAGHDDQVDADHGDRHRQVLRQQRLGRVEELRQDGEDEDNGLGVAGIDDEAAQYQGAGMAATLVDRFGMQVAGCCGPLFPAEIKQVEYAEPFDQREGHFRAREDGANAGGDDGDLQDQRQLQADGVPEAAAETKTEPGGHRGNGTGAGRQADDPTGDEEGEPGVEGHW